MIKTCTIILFCGTLSWGQSPLAPYYKYTRTVVAASDLEGKNYMMVPILLRLGPTDLLVGYKRGYSHAGDSEADFEILRMNPATERVSPERIDLHRPNLDFQDGELVRFPNGDIVCYIDVQAPPRP